MKRCVSLFVFVASLFLLLSTVAFADSGTIEIATVGDSITWGSCSGDTIGSKVEARTYQGYLRTYLGNGYTVRNYGVSGLSVLPDPVYLQEGNTDTGFGAIHNSTVKKALQSSPDVVLIMLGTNDSKATSGSKIGVWNAVSGGRDNFYRAYKELVQSFCDLKSQPKVYILLPIPSLPEGYRGRSAYRITNSVLENDIVPVERQVAEELKLDVIDVRAAFPDENTSAGKLQLSNYLMDAVHPNYKGYELIAKTVAKSLGVDAPDNETNGNDTQTPQEPTVSPTPAAPSSPSFFHLSYNAGGAKGSVPVNDSIYRSGGKATVASPDDLYYPNHDFAGWSTSLAGRDTLYQPGQLITLTSDITLYAIWNEKPRYTLYCHTDPTDSSLFVSTGTYYRDESVILSALAEPSYDSQSYSFLGWSNEPQAAQPLSADSVIICEGDLHLYACYEKIVTEPIPESDEETRESQEDVSNDSPEKDTVSPQAQNLFHDTISVPSFWRQYDHHITIVCLTLILLGVIWFTHLLLYMRKKKTNDSPKSHLDPEESE